MGNGKKCLLGLVVLLAPQAFAQAQPTSKTIPADQLAFFEKKIRPVLVAQCYSCHSSEAEKPKGKLVLDTREGIRKGGVSGPAVIPGNTKDSLLLLAIRYHDESLRMPPKAKLSETIVADFEQWIKMGAPDPRDGGVRAAAPEIDIARGKEFWAFQQPKKTPAPQVKNPAWARNDIDLFLLAEMEARGVKPVADADRRALLRRVYFDLTGLPPSPADIDAFVKDTSDDALAKVVDRLLASPQFGERWGRHWLDVARFGETSGKQVNFNYPHAWRYRDYVIAAFNADKPYNQFVKEQIAGDLLPTSDDKTRADRLVATGFLAIGSKDHNERSRLQFTMDVIDEQIDAMSQAFLGLTVSCARCHDHKFDPIPMKDYYALAGIFKSTTTLYGTIRIIQNNHPSQLATLPASSGAVAGADKLTASEKARIQKQVDDLKAQREKLQKEGNLFGSNQGIFLGIQLATAEARLANYDSEGNPKLLAMAVRDSTFGSDSPLYLRGEVEKPSTKVPRGFLQVMTAKQPRIYKGSGRLELAEWLASRDNPLTARVMVNRVWLHLIGEGLVGSPDNFGASGQMPSHPALLDNLAVDFMDQDGWSVKKLIRRIVLSRAYQLSSQPHGGNQEIDPDNRLLWRMSKRRLEAEAIRDAMLSISGQLDLAPLKGSAIAKAGDGYVGQFQRAGLDPKFAHRSVYMPIVRTGVNEMLALFDFPDPAMVTGHRATTVVPAQGLFFLNNAWVIKQAEATAGRLMALPGGDRDRVAEAYLRFFGRPPSDLEAQQAEEFLGQYARQAAGKLPPGLSHRRQAWTALCQAFFGSAEFLMRN